MISNAASAKVGAASNRRCLAPTSAQGGRPATERGSVSAVAGTIPRPLAFVESVGALALANGASAAVSLVQGVVVARWLGPSLYGVAALVIAYPTMVQTIFSARSSDVSVRYLGIFHQRSDHARLLATRKWCYTIDVAIAVVSALVVALTSRVAATRLTASADTAGLMTLYSLALIPSTLAGTSYAVLAVTRSFGTIAVVETVSAALRASLVIAFVLLGWGVPGVIWASAAGEALWGVIYITVAAAGARRVFDVSPFAGSYAALRGYRREIFGFLLSNDLTVLVALIPRQLDLLLLGYFRNPAEAGYYRLAKSLSSIANYALGPLQRVTYPDLVQVCDSGDRSALRQRVRRLLLTVGLPIGGAMLAAALLMPAVVRLLVGGAYAPAVFPAQLMLASASIWLSFFWMRPLFLARGATIPWLKINAVVGVVSLLAYFFAVRQGGYIGLAACSSVIAILSTVLGLWWLARNDVE